MRASSIPVRRGSSGPGGEAVPRASSSSLIMGGLITTPRMTTWRSRPFGNLPTPPDRRPSTRWPRLGSMTLRRGTGLCGRNVLTKSRPSCWPRPCQQTDTSPPSSRRVPGSRSASTIARLSRWPRSSRSCARSRPSCSQNSSGRTSSGWRRSPTVTGCAPPMSPSTSRSPVGPSPSRPSVHPSERITHAPG